MSQVKENCSTYVPLIVLTIVCVTGGAAAPQPPPTVEYGKYLVEEVSQCQNCHTPRAETGELDRSRWLKGAVLNVQPIEPIKGWHKTAPDITPGSKLWAKWTEAGMRKYLETGLTPNGKPADAPMPAYKLKPADAAAMVEYLKTLK